jgi:hypothetical protein
MGTSNSYITNLRERHANALYINIPIDEKHIDVVNSLTLALCILDNFNNFYYSQLLLYFL